MKTFIKVTSTYSCKNKLHKAIYQNLKELEFTLCKYQQDAVKLVNLAFNDAVNNYKGTAKAPELRISHPNTNTTLFTVEDVISLSLYVTNNDLT